MLVTGAFGGLRVLAFCDYFGPHPGGGAERAALEIYRRLVSLGATVRVLTANRAGDWPRSVHGIEVETVPLLDLSPLLRAQVALAPELFRRVERVASEFKPTVLHANGLYFQSSLAAAWLQLRTNLPLVTTVHIGSLSHLPVQTRTLAGLWEWTLGELILRSSRRVIAVSGSVRDHLIGLGLAQDRIDIALNGVEMKDFDKPRLPADPGRQPNIVFVGRLIENKGPHILLEALRRLDGEHLDFSATFVGDGPMHQRLERKVVRLGLQRRVKFVGHLDDVASQLAVADIFVRPSLTEGLPLALLEAMAARVCVVASDIPGNRDLVRNEHNGLLFRPYDSQSLADVLRRALRSPIEARWLADAGYETARSYSWENTARRTGESLLSAALLTRRQEKRAA